MPALPGEDRPPNVTRPLNKFHAILGAEPYRQAPGPLACCLPKVGSDVLNRVRLEIALPTTRRTRRPWQQAGRWSKLKKERGLAVSRNLASPRDPWRALLLGLGPRGCRIGWNLSGSTRANTRSRRGSGLSRVAPTSVEERPTGCEPYKGRRVPLGSPCCGHLHPPREKHYRSSRSSCQCTPFCTSHRA
jgi:hypothetical protein